MKITVNGRQMNVWDQMKEIIVKKVSKLDKYFGEEGSATVTLSSKKSKKTLEITIWAANTIFRSEIADENFGIALDRAIDAIERQIRKNKTRLAKRLRDIPQEFDVSGFPEEPVEEETEFRIREKSFVLKPMSVEEAIMQMNLLGHEFFVFLDDKTLDTCVVYARHDNEYGLIIPKKEN